MLSVDCIEHLIQLGMLSSVLSLLINWLTLCGGLTEACIMALLLWGITAAIYIYRDTQQVDPSSRTVFVSGCDSGFGLELALQLHTLGFRVLAGCLHANSNGAIHLRQESTERITVVQFDISDPMQVQKAAQKVEQLVQTDGLWCLVNNAGVMQVGAVEWIPLENYRTVMEVNQLGTISLTKVLLPSIRKAKGRVVTISSAVAELPSPLLSPYVISKHAIEGFSKCLRLEMKQFDVDVILVQPGNYTARTNILNLDKMQNQLESMWSSMSEEVKSAYGEASLKVFFSRWSETQVQGDEKDDKKDEDKTEVDGNNNVTIHKNLDIGAGVIDALSSAVIQRWPHAIYRPMGIRMRLKQAMAQHLPFSVFETIYYT